MHIIATYINGLMPFIIWSELKIIWAHFCLSNFKKGKGFGTSLVVQWLGLHASTARVWVQSLVGKLRSCMMQGMAKIIKVNK